MNVSKAVFVCCIAATHSVDLQKRIVNGEEVTSWTYPHHASLQIYHNGEWAHYCGAVIIADKKLLTAAHCFLRDDNADNYAVLLGTLNLNHRDTSAQFIRVGSFKKHPGFKADVTLANPNDIAIVHLKSPINFNDHVQPAKFARKGSAFFYTNCVMIGWGRVNNTWRPSNRKEENTHLMQAIVLNVPSLDCQSFVLPFETIRNHICVLDKIKGTPLERSTICRGDGGGPLMCGKKMEYVAGIASFGSRNCIGSAPGFYTRVSRYLQWMDDN